MLGGDRLVNGGLGTEGPGLGENVVESLSSPESFLSRLQAWRSLSRAEQHRRILAGDEDFQPSNEPEIGRLRVGLWCPCLGLGGAEVWQLALARAVDRSRIVWKGAAVLEGKGASDPRMVRALAATMPVGHGSNAARALAAVSDVIVTWAVADVDGLLSDLKNPPAIVMACHFPAESPWGPGTENLLRSVQRFVAVSELAVESTPASVRDRLEVIWNAVDPARVERHRDRLQMRRGWNVPAEARVVGYIGRLSPEKDPDAMLRLAAELPEPWHVVLVGEGREREPLMRQVAEKRLDRVHLVGGDPSAGDVLSGFDTLLVPSRYESFGLTLAEGLYQGVPVVATRSGLARLVPGLVREIPVEASGLELREALLADLDDVEGTRRRVEDARSFARERLSLERFGREWTSLLARVYHLARLGAWRSLTRKEQVDRLAASRPNIDPSLRDAVNACAHRGSELPISADAEESCCGAGPTRWRCGRGLGKRPGQVTLAECLACVGGGQP